MPALPETPAPLPGPLVTGAFRKGPRYHTYREQGTRDWLLILTVGGQGVFRHEQGTTPVTSGDMILLKPNTRHDYATAPGQPHWDLLWAHFMPQAGWLDWLDWPEHAPGVLGLQWAGQERQEKIVRRFRDLIRLNTSPLRLREALAMNALEEIVLWCDLINPRSESARRDRRIRRSLDFISEHLAEPLSVARIAAHCGLSPSRFAHLFRAEMRETPQHYLELQRLNRARQLLEFTQEPVRQIARQVGFENPFYFSLRFKRHSGIGPREWRQRRRGAA